MKKVICSECKKECVEIEEAFHGFIINGWKCLSCGEVIFDEEVIQPILEYNKIVKDGEKLEATLSLVGNNLAIRFPKIIEKIYHLKRRKKVSFDLKPNGIVVEV
ncbi:MAG: hypothetical protein COS08_07870 [Euryarchaeota archaeon CG01_land_8_20_14_3_00_38_12]|nr:MAG: hypothetical protein COS08_07870 [Euryarchaeota archaeon CG01_land_8_20_14_3_00_38_12]PJB21484.1 MAG: hypothetical protein CO114_05060 [Euryarchaeota archaeon CG_4_9_14_3_um_filter_38_12]